RTGRGWQDAARSHARPGGGDVGVAHDHDRRRMRGVIAPRWRKVLRDITGTPLRTSLAIIAMAIGAFGVSMILTSYSILTRELKTTYTDTRPASAILILDAPVTDALVDTARRVPGVADAEARPVIG